MSVRPGIVVSFLALAAVSSAQFNFQLTAPTGVGTDAWVYTKNTNTASRFQKQGQFGAPLARFQRQTWEGLYMRVNENNVAESNAMNNLVESELIGTQGFIGKYRPDLGAGSNQVEVTATYNLLATQGGGADLKRNFKVRNLSTETITIDLFFGVEMMINAQFGPDPDGTNDLGQLASFGAGAGFDYRIRELEVMLPTNVLATDSGFRTGFGDVNANLIAWQTAPRIVGQGFGALELDFSNTVNTNLNSTDFPTLLGTNHIGIQMAVQYRATLGPGDSTFEINPDSSITVVPEPGTLAILGLGALAFVRRRKN